MSKEIMAFEIIKTIRKRMKMRDDWVAYHHFVRIYPEELDIIENALKALEIIKECFTFNAFDDLIPNGKWYESKEKQDLLKEVLTNGN